MKNKELLTKIALEEWNYFGNQEIIGCEKNLDGTYKLDKDGDTIPIFKKLGHREEEAPYYLRVGKYWKEALNEPHTGLNHDAYWSAAFISYLMLKSGLTKNDFLFNEQHSKYIRKAIVAKQNSDNDYGFWGYRLKEYKPEIGDLVCYVRRKAVGVIAYDSNDSDYESHADLVVEKEGNILKVIGGNVSDSVTMKHLILDENGFLIDKTKNWFVVLKNNRKETDIHKEDPEGSSEKLIVTGDGVRLRTNPSKQEGNILASLYKGNEVDFYELSEDKLWSKVRFNNQIGWLYNLYLKSTLPLTTDNSLNNILDIVSKSTIINYSWRDRGKAPMGYYQGMAVMFARLYCKLKGGDEIVKEMAKPATGNSKKDSMSHYEDIFEELGMDNEYLGADTLRHLFVMMVGLGLRESSGRHCVGRDTTANNVDSETAEAGLFQTSYNVRSVSLFLPVVYSNYKANPDGFIEIFSNGVTCGANNWYNHGDGEGKIFQKLSKECPGFAVEFTAVAMRNTSRHWGPIINKKVEIKSECDVMFLKIQNYIDQNNIIAI